MTIDQFRITRVVNGKRVTGGATYDSRDGAQEIMEMMITQERGTDWRIERRTISPWEPVTVPVSVQANPNVVIETPPVKDYGKPKVVRS